MVAIYKWTQIDNLPFGLHNYFDYIREECELLMNPSQFDIAKKAEEMFTTDFPQFFKDQTFDDLISVDCYEFDDCEPEDQYTYAVYICIHRDLVIRMIEHLFKNHTDYIKKEILG